MSIPPLCKCQQCGSACLWISTLCSNCIREIEDAQKLEESQRPPQVEEAGEPFIDWKRLDENRPEDVARDHIPLTTLGGFQVRVDPTLPPGVAQIRDGKTGKLLGEIREETP